MLWRPRNIVVCCALAGVLAPGCGGGGGGDSTPFNPQSGFPQGFLPVRLASSGGSGDVAFRPGGDLYAVDGSSHVTAVSRTNGQVSTFANNVGGASNVLRSIVVGPDGRLFAGDNAGQIWAIAADGTPPAVRLVDIGSDPITGLAIAPTGFGDFAESLVVAAGASGILTVSTGSSPVMSTLTPPGSNYVDVAFSGTTLFALDQDGHKIDTVSAIAGTAPTLFQDDFSNPVGLAVNDGQQEILVADAGTDELRAVPVAGGTPINRAPYDFDPIAPSGIAYDGVATLAWIARGSVVVFGATVPGVDPASANFTQTFLGPTVGYGDLEFDRDGGFLVVANDPDDPNISGDSVDNFLFNIARDGSVGFSLASGIGSPGEQLLSLAVDPATETIYIGTDQGNVYQRTADGTVSLVISATADAVLGLELAPEGFTGFGGRLIATTDQGEVFPIDPVSQTRSTAIATIPGTSGQPARLSDLVFKSDGTLYVLDNGQTNPPGKPRILRVAPGGGVADLHVNSAQLVLPDGIEIDEGGNRLLVATAPTGGDLLVAVSLAVDPPIVTPVASTDIAAGFFPTGVVYDRLGTAIVHKANSSLDAVPAP